MTAFGRIPFALAVVTLFLLPLGALAQLPPGETPNQPAPAPGLPAVEPVPVRLDLPLVGTVSGGGAGTFNGTLTLARFAEQNGQVAAVGMVTGIVTGANGAAGSVFQGPLAFPVTLRTGTAPAAAVSFGPAPTAPADTASNGLVLAQAPQTCPPLRLQIGAVSLNALGVTVATGPVELDIAGEGGATDALGALVCQAPATAGNVPGLVALLNEILAVLAV